MKDLQHKIHYQFHDQGLLRLALTHSSCTHEKSHVKNNQRLEFLGDSVLSMVVASYLYTNLPKEDEGMLTKIRASLVCDYALAELALKIGLGDHLIMGKGEEHSGGRRRKSNLEDAFEALVGAVFLDGGYEAAQKFVLQFMPKTMDENRLYSNHDYKTALQEVIQKNPEENLSYLLVAQSGPDHDKTFESEVHLNSNVIGRGIGKSKKQAEQMAAKQALLLMGYKI